MKLDEVDEFDDEDNNEWVSDNGDVSFEIDFVLLSLDEIIWGWKGSTNWYLKMLTINGVTKQGRGLLEKNF